MDTETPIPTETPEPTMTLTPSATFTPTLDFFIEIPLGDGMGARVERSVTAGDYTIIILTFVLLISFWGYALLRELRGDKS